MMITSFMVRENFVYRDGRLYRKKRTHERHTVGECVGYVRKDGYIRVGFIGKLFYLHRMIWMYFNGNIPDGYTIDHIDGNPFNCDIKNLRLALQSQNIQNRRRFNSRTLPGTSYNAKRNDYLSRVVLNGKTYRKYFKNEIDAHEWYLNKKRELHEFCTI